MSAITGDGLAPVKKQAWLEIKVEVRSAGIPEDPVYCKCNDA